MKFLKKIANKIYSYFSVHNIDKGTEEECYAIKLEKFNNLTVMLYVNKKDKTTRIEYLPNKFEDQDIVDEVTRIINNKKD